MDGGKTRTRPVSLAGLKIIFAELFQPLRSGLISTPSLCDFRQKSRNSYVFMGTAAIVTPSNVIASSSDAVA
jgi:hypothetical protein